MDAARKGAAARRAAAARKAAAVGEAGGKEAAAGGPPQLPLVDSQEAGATNLWVRRRPQEEWAEGHRPRTPVALPQAVEAKAKEGRAARPPEEWQAPGSRRPRTAATLRRRATGQTGNLSLQLKSGSKLQWA